MGRSKKSTDQQQENGTSPSNKKELENPDDVLTIEEEEIVNTNDRPPLGEGHWNVKKFCKGIVLRMVHQSADKLDLEFDLINVEAPVANALRRILIAEVPSMAIEKVFLYQNTSCIQDEVFCHRLGLIPIYADARKFAFPPLSYSSENQQINTDYLDEEPPGNSEQNLVFELHVVCPSDHKGKKKRGAANSKASHASVGAVGSESDSEEVAGGRMERKCVKEANDSGNWVAYSNAFNWIPIDDQKKQFEKDPPRLVHNDIILAKLRPGQEIEASCHCVKGIGRDHAKFSPVATATYRLLPQIKLKRDDFDDEQADRLQSSFASGVIGRDERSGRAFVKDARSDTSSRNVFIHEDLKDAVQMDKKKTHFIFSVESTGALPANQLIVEACKVMKEKVEHIRKQINSRLEML